MGEPLQKLDFEHIDKTAFSVAKLGEDDTDEFWRSRSPDERLEYMEHLRRMNYGNAATARLQRVLEVARRSWR